MFHALKSEFEVRVGDRTAVLDRLIAQNVEEVETLRRLWAGASHLATVIAVASNLPQGIEKTLESKLSACNIATAGATRFGDVVICRVLADEAWACHEAVYACWAILRPFLAGKAARPIRKC
jgi:urease accessory protein UreH